MIPFKNKLFRKDNDIYYRFESDLEINDKAVAEERIKKIIEPGTPFSSCWWKNLKTKSNEFKNQAEYYLALHKKAYLEGNQEVINSIKNGDIDETNSSIKTCPAVLAILKKVFVVKAPCDFLITIDREGRFLWNVSKAGCVSITSHHESQFYNDNPSYDIFKDKINIKISLNTILKTQNTYLYLPAFYHNTHPELEVPMGMIEGKLAKYGKGLNVNTMIKVEKDEIKTISIKEGDALCYILPLSPAKLKFSKHNFLQCL